jgi:hypothetical protein
VKGTNGDDDIGGNYRSTEYRINNREAGQKSINGKHANPRAHHYNDKPENKHQHFRSSYLSDAPTAICV